jgi:hypothetical protein
MITRGFTLGVLIPNALCMLLAVISVLELDQDANRLRTQRRSRTGSQITRLVRTAPGGAAGVGRPTLFV